MNDKQRQLREEIEKLDEPDPVALIAKMKDAATSVLGANTVVRVAPFGIRFAELAPIVADGNATGTSASVSVTVSLPPDTDTDPPDSD